MQALTDRFDFASSAGAKHVFGWAPENVHVFIAAFNRYEGDAEATWSDAERLDREMHTYFVETVGVPAAQAVRRREKIGRGGGERDKGSTGERQKRDTDVSARCLLECST